MSKKRIRKIQALIRADLEKGERSENRVEEVLQTLITSQKIHHYYRAEHGGELDRQGIDFLVFTQPDQIIPLQVKSSAWGRECHLVEHGGRIPCVAVDPYQEISDLSEAIIQELRLPLEFPEPAFELKPVFESEGARGFNTFPALI
ncbi:MAG: hypothetical protein AAB338_01735 [Patescibacteria group bacterium]